MENSVQIAVVSSSSALPDKIKQKFSSNSTKVFIAPNFSTFLSEFEFMAIDILIVDSQSIKMSETLYLEKLKEITEKNSTLQIIFLADEEDIELAVKTLSIGTYHYIKLPIHDEELNLLIRSAIEDQPNVIENKRSEHRSKLGEIIGASLPMQKVYDQIIQSSKAEIPVLILGETGTGKDLVANTIHRMSKRSEKPFIPLNLGALPTQLVSSELFGHEKGSFTGAINQHKGVFEQAKFGTVFLDEIDSIDEKVQVSLLRLLEQKKLKRLGGRNFVKTDARLISATNEDIDNLVESGSFRIDLFYRIDVFRITVPPLRKRQGDIPLLVNEMVLRYNQMYKKNIVEINQEAIDSLMSYEWPGNVRELKNAVQRAVLVCNEEVIGIEHLPPRFQKNIGKVKNLTFPVGTRLDEMEKEMIVNVLISTNNNKKKAAEQLGISRRSLYNKIEKYSIHNV